MVFFAAASLSLFVCVIWGADKSIGCSGMAPLPFSLSRRQGLALSLLLPAALLLVAARQLPRTSDSLLQWIPMNFFSPYAAVPFAADGGSTIRAFSQKLVPMQDSVDLDTPNLGYGYRKLQKQALYYRKRLARLNQVLHNRIYNAYRKHLLQRGIAQPAASSLALLQSELDALNAHVTLLARELDDKNQLSAHMANLQSLALAKMMAKVNRLAVLVHTSAIRRIRHSIPKPLRDQHAATVSRHEKRTADCPHHALCTSSDLKWMRQLSRALSLIQAQSIHQAQMMRHVTSLSHEVESLRLRLHRRNHVHRHHHYDEMRGRRPVALSQRSVPPPVASEAAEASSLTATSASARKLELDKVLDKVEALNLKSPGSRSLDGLYAEIHSLQSVLSTLPAQKL